MPVKDRAEPWIARYLPAARQFPDEPCHLLWPHPLGRDLGLDRVDRGLALGRAPVVSRRHPSRPILRGLNHQVPYKGQRCDGNVQSHVNSRPWPATERARAAAAIAAVY